MDKYIKKKKERDDAAPRQILPAWMKDSNLNRRDGIDFMQFLTDNNYVVCKNRFACTCITLIAEPCTMLGASGAVDSKSLACSRCTRSRCLKCEKPTKVFYDDIDGEKTVCFDHENYNINDSDEEEEEEGSESSNDSEAEKDRQFVVSDSSDDKENK